MGYKILIVDDEPLLRESIKIKLNGCNLNFEEITVAEDGIDALEKLQLISPDIIITDIRMPELDGLLMIEKIMKINSSIKFIIVSGYGEFEYAKKAISFGVEEYLLKPIDPSELKQSLIKVIRKIEEEKEIKRQIIELKRNFKKSNRREKEKKLCDHFFECTAENELKNGMFGADSHYNTYLVATLKLKQFQLEDLGFKKNEKELMVFCVRNIIEQLIIEDKGIIYFENYRNPNEFVFIFGNKQASDPYYLVKSKMTRIIININNYLHIHSVSGIGLEVNLEDLTKSHNQARYASNQRFIEGYEKVYLYKDVIRQPDAIISKEYEVKEVLTIYMEEGKVEEALNYVERLLFNLIDKPNINFIHIKNICIDIYVCVKDFLIKYNLDVNEVWDDKYENIDSLFYLDEIQQIVTIMGDYVVKAINMNVKLQKLTGEDIVNEVIHLINNNYKDNINLSVIANKYYINRNYFCKIFKEITGKSFIDYLTQVRVLKACQLMQKTNMPINQIAYLVGYNESKYFSKVFKKQKGMTPTEYIESIRMN